MSAGDSNCSISRTTTDEKRISTDTRQDRICALNIRTRGRVVDSLLGYLQKANKHAVTEKENAAPSLPAQSVTLPADYTALWMRQPKVKTEVPLMTAEFGSNHVQRRPCIPVQYIYRHTYKGRRRGASSKASCTRADYPSRTVNFSSWPEAAGGCISACSLWVWRQQRTEKRQTRMIKGRHC